MSVFLSRTVRLSVFPSRVTNLPFAHIIVRSQFEVGRTGCPSFRAGLLTLLTRPKIALQRANSSQRSLRRIVESEAMTSPRRAEIFGSCGVSPQSGGDLRSPFLRRDAAATICGRWGALVYEFVKRFTRLLYTSECSDDSSFAKFCGLRSITL